MQTNHTFPMEKNEIEEEKLNLRLLSQLNGN